MFLLLMLLAPPSLFWIVFLLWIYDMRQKELLEEDEEEYEPRPRRQRRNGNQYKNSFKKYVR